MSGPNDKVRQHYVPDSYLKAWRDPLAAGNPQTAKQVWRFKIDGSNGERISPKSIFRENDFYTIFGDDGTRDLTVEDGLGDIETRFGKVRKERFTVGQWPTPDEMHDVLMFAVSMSARTLGMRDFQAEQWRSIASRMEEMRVDVESNLSSPTPEQRKFERVRAGLRDVEKGPTISLEQVRALADRPQVHVLRGVMRAALPRFAQMSVAVLFAVDDSVPIITTDDPCVWIDPGRPNQPVALSSKTVEITLPISPRLCLLLSYDKSISGFYPLTPDQIHGLNQLTISHAYKWFISDNQTTYPQWFVR